MNFSVVIPTLNAGTMIEGLLERINSQTIQPSEILVIDSSSTDLTQEIVKKFRNVKLHIISKSNFNHGNTRHEGVMLTKGEFICFLTQDALPANSHYFENLLKPFHDENIAMVSGRQLPKHNARRFERYVREYNYSDKSFVRSEADIPVMGIKAFFATDVCAAYRRTAYLACGGFDQVNTNEDMLMAAKFLNSGYEVAYAADACVYHSHNFSLEQQYKRNKEIGIFLSQHAALFAGLSEIKEGNRLVKDVSMRLLREGHFIEFIAFGNDCVARLIGNRVGRYVGTRR